MKTGIIAFIISMSVVMNTNANEARFAPHHRISNTVTVSGAGLLDVSPDVSFVALTILTIAELAQDAQAQNAIETKRLVDSLSQKYELEKDQITTSSYSLSAERNPDDPSVITGYVVRHSVIVRVFFVEKIGELLDFAIASGATTIDYIQFGLRNQKQYELRALKLAMNDSRLKADAIANSVGREIIRVIKVSEGQYSVENEKQADENRDSGTEIFPSPVSLSVTLNVTYEF